MTSSRTAPAWVALNSSAPMGGGAPAVAPLDLALGGIERWVYLKV